MGIKQVLWAGAAAMILVSATSCSSSEKASYKLSNVSKSRILIDQRYDAHPDMAATKFIAPYKHKVDSMMGPVMGTAAESMTAHRPESKLSNLLADILMWKSKAYGETPDFGVYNIGGMRAAISKGKVTYGDILDVAPFENKICFITLSGEKVTELFQQIARIGGEAVSHGVELVITKDGQLLSAKLNGKAIDPKANYRVVTIDYVAQGNDKMEAFKSGTNLVSPQEKSNNVMFVIMDYFRDKAKAGEAVSSKIEGRIVVKD